MRRFDNVLWDVDGTLLDFHRSEQHSFLYCLESFGITAREEMYGRYSAINDSCWKRLERGELTKQEVVLGRFRLFLDEFGITQVSAEAFQEAFQHELGSVFFFQENAYELCSRLCGVCRQYIVTNGVTWTQRSRLRLSGLDKLMQDIFISEQFGCHKPQKEFFDLCFQKIGSVDKNRTLIVGDSLTSDIKGGNNAGIKTCWYNPEGLERQEDVQVDYEIRRLEDVENIIGS